MHIRQHTDFISSITNKKMPQVKSAKVWILSIAVLLVVDIFLLKVDFGAERKIGANKIMSPWDTSCAPSPYINPNSIKIHKGCANTVVSQRDVDKKQHFESYPKKRSNRRSATLALAVPNSKD